MKEALGDGIKYFYTVETGLRADPLRIRSSTLHLDCPYERIIEIYKEVKKRFESIGWKEESSKLIDSIRYYKEKLEKDNKLREIEEKKLYNSWYPRN